jgi:hypothetical protein
VTGLAQWEKWVVALGRCGKGKQDGERKACWLRKIGPKVLREYRKSLQFSEVEVETKSDQIRINYIRNLILEHTSIQK